MSVFVCVFIYINIKQGICQNALFVQRDNVWLTRQKLSEVMNKVPQDCGIVITALKPSIF